jgi:hypothetical protein
MIQAFCWFIARVVSRKSWHHLLSNDFQGAEGTAV